MICRQQVCLLQPRQLRQQKQCAVNGNFDVSIQESALNPIKGAMESAIAMTHPMNTIVPFLQPRQHSQVPQQRQLCEQQVQQSPVLQTNELYLPLIPERIQMKKMKNLSGIEGFDYGLPSTSSSDQTPIKIQSVFGAYNEHDKTEREEYLEDIQNALEDVKQKVEDTVPDST